MVLIASAAALGLSVLSTSLNEAVLFLPKLLVALAIVLLGVVVADFVRGRVDAVAERMDVELPLGRAAQLAVLTVFALTALAQLGVSTSILTAVAGVVLVGMVFTVSLAFGLGGRDVARQLTAGRYVGASFELGQTIGVAGVRGRIAAFESAAVRLRTDDGRMVRVPNQLLLESVVEAQVSPEGSEASSSTP